MLAPLDNETIFKRAFTDKEVFQQFVKDLFDVDIVVAKIETEKMFHPTIANIDFKLDIYAETVDHRFVIEIQKIDYDHNFYRFLGYFLSLIIEQQQKASDYNIPQTVLGVVVLSRPYKIDQLTGQPIKDSVMMIDFDPRNIKDERVKLFEHKLLFLNSNQKYNSSDIPKNYQDWLDLFKLSINSRLKITLNLNNKGIAKTAKLIEFENIDPFLMEEIKIAESKKQMKAIERNEVISKIVKELYKNGVSLEIISLSTKLSIEKINEILKKHKLIT